jgi:hypothetical protein
MDSVLIDEVVPMDYELGSFSDNWEIFNAALRAFDDGKHDRGIALARMLLAGVRDVKTQRWIQPRLERRLVSEARGRVRRVNAA